jgi:peptidoglycan-associated lipoprotein
MTPDRDTFRDQTVYFAFDRADVRPSEVSKLERVASEMKSTHAGKALRIEGHCDERGTEEYNRSLGEKRAASVRETLVRLGMNPAMIQTISMGEEHPAVPGHDEAAWSKNRRGEIILLSPPTATAQGGTSQ